MILLLLLFGELVLLYLFSRTLIQGIYDLVYLATRARSVGIMVVSLLSFPGTVVHELAHLFTAEVLGVHTGKLTLVPENLQEPEIKAGSVMIASSDPFRRYLIGLAPMFAGMVAISALAYLLSQSQNGWLTAFYFYLLFAVSNSMFSSREDLKGFIPFAITIIILIASAFVAGFRIGLTGALLGIAMRILDTLTKNLGIVLGINLVGLVIIKLLARATEKITHRRLIRRSL